MHRHHEPSLSPERSLGRRKKADTRRNDDQLQARLNRLEVMYREATGKQESKKLAVVMQEAGQSPLSENLLRFPFTRKCSLPTFTSPFTGTGDAIEHLRTYCMTLTQWDHYDVVLCKFFPASLRDETLMWFNNLPKRSVNSFDHLSELVLETYIHNSRIRPEFDALFQMSRGPNESLHSLVTRWRKLCSEIGKVPEDYAILGFKNSLRKTYPLFVRMYETMPKNLGKLRQIQEDYVALEELQDGTYDKMAKGSSRGANVVEPQNPQVPAQGAGRSNSGSTQFDKHQTRGSKGRDQAQQKKGKGQQPARTENRNDFCEFHQFHSHTTDSCRDLKKVLQDMINEWKLQECIAQPTIPPTAGSPIHGVEIPSEAQYLGCNTISHSTITTPLREGNITGRIHKRNFKGDEVFSVAREPPMEELMKLPISFSASEAPDGGRNHNDPLVVTMAIALPEHEGEEGKPKALPWALPRILIDGGSSVEILFYETFKQMGLRDECLIPSAYNIFGFNGSSTRPRAR
ncbi:uncharacterized protein LOC113335709 [Papaver somniferum]|uniref:uncharacterized protein LOC113335709 n=1 Tax=Papaver somniferum TaxID=3469 RepID=UPI000E6F8847|nr:uncharacterized protein LOC113335709 [Papaver somniferum]